LGAEIPDRVHDEARLHAHRGAVAAVDPLDLARDEPVRDIVRPGAAIALDRRAEKTEPAHLVHDLAVEALFAVRGQYARHQLFLAPRAECRPVPRPRPIFLANSERCWAYFGATIG